MQEKTQATIQDEIARQLGKAMIGQIGLAAQLDELAGQRAELESEVLRLKGELSSAKVEGDKL